ncbi:MAG: hypothetical protein COA42_07690 [Alteromonadaceae bacterium]|nr:MAG: hypothetical protein COA42_07690 [Alteromonadaceae bacterium]
MVERPTELTEEALSKRLLSESTNHPFTLSTGVIGLLGGGAAVLFASSELFVGLSVLGGLGLLASAGFVLAKNLFGRSKSMLSIVEQVRKEVMKKRIDIAGSVKDNLSNFSDQKGLIQLEQLQAKFAAFESVLALQFDRDELTFKRFLTTAEQLYFGSIDNLRRLAMQRHSISAIDIVNIESRLASVDISSEEKSTFEKRKIIYDNANKSMESIYSINEQAMTKLDELTNKLGSIQTRSGVADVRLETAMKEILHLISRTDEYDISN